MVAPRYVKAKYTPALMPEHQGNPLIEALPPTLPTEAAMRELRGRRPVCTEQERAMDAVYRMKAVRRIRSLFTVHSVHSDLHQRIRGMIESGYETRNPMLPGTTGSLQKRIKELEHAIRAGTFGQTSSGPAQGFTIIGVSGVGKSTAIKRILANYSQVIGHSSYNGRRFLVPQVVYLYLECPANRTIKSLCQAFITAIDELLVDTHYFEKYGCKKASTEWLSIVMAIIAKNHHLGALVIDEVQNLRTQNGSDVILLNFLVELSNKLNVPILLIGTPDAADVLTQFRMQRRGTGEGDLTWDRLSETSKEWKRLVKDLWKYQYTANFVERTDDLSAALYDESQGITDLAIKAFALTQIRAILNGSEQISVDLLRQTAKDAFSLCQKALMALRSGEAGALRLFSDIYLRKVFDASFFDKHWKAGLATVQRGESLDLMNEYNSMATDGADLVAEIAAWLTEAGVENEKALRAAEDTVLLLGKDADPRNLRSAAYDRCFGNPEEKIGRSSRRASRARNTNHASKPGLAGAVQAGVKNGEGRYEAIKNAGFTLSSPDKAQSGD